MRRLTIVRLTRKGDYIHVEGLDIMALSEEEYQLLKEVLNAKGYRNLRTS